MIFTVGCSKYFFDDREKPEYEKMGFSFIRSAYNDRWSIDQNNLPMLCFNNIENLKTWVDAYHKCAVIISFDPNIIEIYNDYRE